jgi:digalactosyldiacylglycerol synthase
MTGTSVNPLLRAAYLAHRDDGCRVTLVVPWLAPCDQKLVHPNAIFEDPEQQIQHIRGWLAGRVGFEPTFAIHFYPGRYAIDKGSIVPVGDITACVPAEHADVAVLEEPEHLTWFHHGTRWSAKFTHVVGVIHTNYLEYARREKNGARKEAVLRGVNATVARAHCHKIIKLSNAVQDFARSITVNVHGVSPHFVEVGGEVARAAEDRAGRGEASSSGFTKGGYFIGKVVWAKGYLELLERVKEYNDAAAPADQLTMDVFGNGDDFQEVRQAAQRKGLALFFHGRADHASEVSREYKFFINPSLSDVLATTTAEALAMGKFVVCARHPSNEFFSSFANCRTYSTPDEFAACVREVLHSEPEPISPEHLHRLTWQAATERFLDAAEPDLPPPTVRRKVIDTLSDWIAAGCHNFLTASEAMRCLVGGGAGTLLSPDDLAEWQPDEWSGGVMDRKEEEERKEG